MPWMTTARLLEQSAARGLACASATGRHAHPPPTAAAPRPRLPARLPPHVQYMGSSFCPRLTVMEVPAVLKLRTYSSRYLWSAQKWHAGMGDCSTRLLWPSVLLKLKKRAGGAGQGG